MSANIKPAASTSLVLQDEGGTDVITISTSGNVGVGNGSPAQKLDVTGSINATGALTLGTALAIAEGGTGATTASGARTALGLAIGTDVQAYDADTAKYDDTTANFTGTLQNGGSNVVVDSDIGSTVQGYDANTAKLDATTSNFTGTLQNGGSNVVVDSDIGSTVQAYDADLSTIAGLSSADGNFIVGSATGWTVESGATARTSLGLGTLATQSTITESQISDLGSYITASSTDALTNKSGNISQWTNDSGYLTAETNDLGSAVTGTLGVANGGTGLIAIGTANQVLAVNAGATALEFQTLATGGAVTSVAVSGSDGIEVDSGSPITTSGTITLGINAATLSSHLSLGTAATTASTDYATAAQGSLADSAVQPGDDANTLGSGAAADGYVLTADGAGGAAWEAPSGVSLPIDLLSSGASIRKSDGTTAVLSESAGAVTLENTSLGDSVLMPDNSNNVSTAPGIRFEADTDTGIGLASAGNLAVVTGGSERVRVDSSGNVGIGTSSPNARLEVEDAGGGSVILKVTADDGNPYAFVVGNDTFSTSDTNGLAMWVGNDGACKIDARGTGAYHTFRVQGTERMRIDSSGNALIGYTSSNGSYKLQVNSQIFATSAIIATSDGRYKENITSLDGALNLVTQLNPVQFTWKEHPVHEFDRNQPTVGFIAQEVQEVLKDTSYVNSIIKANECLVGEERDEEGNIITEGTTEEFLGIAEGNLIALLTKALQEANAKIDALETRIQALEV